MRSPGRFRPPEVLDLAVGMYTDRAGGEPPPGRGGAVPAGPKSLA